MNGDLLGRVAPEGVQLFQFVIRRNARNGSFRTPPGLLPFVGWFTVDTPMGIPPPNCRCKFSLRADDRTFRAFYEVLGMTLPSDDCRYICPCYGDFLE
jgi:hypothetical protein